MPLDVQLDNFTINVYSTNLLVMTSLVSISAPINVYNSHVLVMTSVEDIPIIQPSNTRNRYFKSFMQF